MRPAELPESDYLGAGHLDSESHFDVREVVQRLRRRWKLIASVVGIALVVAGVQYLITPKEYRATATIQIERRAITPFTQSQTPWLDNWWNMEYYPTQYQLLQSRGLAERVMQNLRLMDDRAFNPGAAPQASAGGTPSSADDRAALGGLAARLQSSLTVEPVANTQLVRLSYRSQSPGLAARAANSFAESFIDWGIESRSTTVGKASNFLGKQIEDLKSEIADREAQLQAYSRSEDIIDFDPQSNVTYQRLAALNKDYIEAVRNRIEKQSHHEELAARPKETVADAQSSGLVGDLNKEQLQLEREYATQLKAGFKPDWPPLVELKGKIDRGRTYLDEVVGKQAKRGIQAAYAEYQTALRQQQKLTNEIESLKREAMDQNLVAVGFSNLQVEIKTRRDLLDDLLRRQSETEVSARLQDTRESNVRIVDEALVPSGAFRPSLPTNLTTGLLAGLLLGIGAAFLLEFLDRSVKTAEELERLLGLAVLAVIPDVDERGGYYGRATVAAGSRDKARWIERKKGDPVHVELAPHDRPRQLVSEAYRSLRTALLLSSAEELKVVAITSAEAGEGKTATVANLGVVLAQLGRRVLIIDTDLRKPRQHEVFQVSNREGLVSFLTGSAAAERIVVRTNIANLHLATSGPIPPNPSELLASERMHSFLVMVRERFDFVILDTPPALAVTDATLIGSAADGVVLCFRAGKVQRDDARACRDRLLRAEVRILGAVLNRFREVRGRYGKHYRHYAAYGEGSGEAPADSAA